MLLFGENAELVGKVSDLGLGRMIGNGSDLTMFEGRSWPYVAPEVLKNNVSHEMLFRISCTFVQSQIDYGQYSERCDVYSLAITLAEALPTGPNGTSQQPFRDIYRQTRREISSFITQNIKERVKEK